MDQHATLHIYEASAGAGKTFSLVRRYLAVILSRPLGYRSVLAVTFTNKATAEIKERILLILFGLSLLDKNTEDKSDQARRAATYLPQLEQEMQWSSASICKKASETLRDILFDYSFFSVQTIDSFFQRVMREFARETGLPFGYTIEMDNRQAVTESVDRMLEEVKPGEPLFRFLVDMVNRFSDEGKWDIRTDLIREGGQLFSEHFVIPEERDPVPILTELEKELMKITRRYEGTVKELGKTGMDLLDRYGYDPMSFSYKKNGVPAMFPAMQEGILKPGQRFINALGDPETMLSAQDKTDSAKMTFASNHLHPLLLKIARFYTNRFPEFSSAGALESMVHGYGIQIVLRSYIHRWIREENRFLISEVNRFLKGIIGDNELPFIYEKIGQHYQTYLLDEFQDTSHFQYHNLKPLMKDSLARGNESLVVGDIKQSIYRWRNSDWSIMAKELPSDFKENRVVTETLPFNRRSCENIILFNNAFFAIAPGVLSGLLNEKIDRIRKKNPMVVPEDISSTTDLIHTAYVVEKLKQQIPQQQKKEGGYVCISFLQKGDHMDWHDEASQRVCEKVSGLISDGYEPGQIALLVRKNDEGARIVRDLLSWQKEHPEGPRYPVISDDALSLDQSVGVRLIMELIRCVEEPDNSLAFANFYYTLQRQGLPSMRRPEDMSRIDINTVSWKERWRYFLPETDEAFFDTLGRLPLSEMIRSIIRTFNLDTLPGEVPFLYALENKALDHIAQGGTGIASFLEWWDDHGKNEKIPLPDSLNAVRVMTIFKAKGLGMDIVMLPFADWPFEITGGEKAATLWCKSDRQPFNRLPRVPVRYRNNLLGSLFSQAYLDEAVSQYIENLNLIYVAFTRAVNQLYLFTCGENGSGRSGRLVVETADKLVAQSTNDVSINSRLHRKTEPNILEFGTYTSPKEPVAPAVPETLTYFPVTPAFDRFRFLPQGRKYFLLKKAGRDIKIDMGNLFHTLLSEIRTIPDIEPAVRRSVRSGLIPATSAGEYITSLHEITESESAADWFSGAWKVLNETSVILPGSVILRPDRVMIKQQQVVVVDYKFGDQEKSSYRRQMKQYMHSITRMGFTSVTGVIWYINLEKQELIPQEQNDE